MRGKGSDQNKLIALAFSKMVVKYTQDPAAEYVCCTGPSSVFEVFAFCLPSCARSHGGQGTGAPNRDGVSVIELNKLLVESGYVCYRKRELAPGTSDVLTRGRRRWRYRSWVNQGTDDLEHLEGHLAAMHEAFPETRHLSTEHIIQGLSALAARQLVCEDTPTSTLAEDMKSGVRFTGTKRRNNLISSSCAMDDCTLSSIRVQYSQRQLMKSSKKQAITRDVPKLSAHNVQAASKIHFAVPSSPKADRLESECLEFLCEISFTLSSTVKKTSTANEG